MTSFTIPNIFIDLLLSRLIVCFGCIFRDKKFINLGRKAAIS